MCGWITGDSPRRVRGAPRRTSAGVYRVVELEHGRHDGASLSLPLSELIELPEEEEEEEEEEEKEKVSPPLLVPPLPNTKRSWWWSRGWCWNPSR